jgi:hypothetical protein
MEGIRKITVFGLYENLNKVLEGMGRKAGKVGFYGPKKKALTNTVALQVKPLQPLEPGRYFVFLVWFCPDKRRDQDNIDFNKKFLFDGLQKGGFIDGDGWAQIDGFTSAFQVEKGKDSPRLEAYFLKHGSQNLLLQTSFLLKKYCFT